MNSSRHFLMAFLVFRPAQNICWLGLRGRTEFVVECSGAGCLLGSAEIGLFRYELVSAPLYYYSGLIDIKSIKKKYCGHSQSVPRSFSLNPKRKTKQTHPEAHSLETVEGPWHSPSLALSCRERGEVADIDNRQISFWSPLLLQSRLSRESYSVKVA